MTGPVLLLVNPSAGAGRALRALPAVEARLRALGVAFATRLTRDLGHARELAARAARAGETVVALSGDGVLGAVAGALRDVPGAVLGVLPGGKGNDFARMPGCRSTPRPPARSWRAGRRVRSTWATPAGGRSSASRRWASTPTPTASPTRSRPGSAAASTSSARCGRSRAGVRPPSRSTSTASAAPSGAGASPPRTRGSTGAGCSSPRTRAWTTAASTSCSRRDDPPHVPAHLPQALPRRARREPVVRVLRGERGARERRPSVHRLRRRRAGRRAARRHPRGPRGRARPAAPMTCWRRRSRPHGPPARSSRRAGRGGTSLPGKLLHAPGAARDRAARGAPGARQRGDLARRTARRRPRPWSSAILERSGARLVHNRAGANMAGGVATALVGARGGADGDRALRGRRVLARTASWPSCARGRSCSPTSSATSSTATASSTRSPSVGRPWPPPRPRALVLNADDPLVADLGRDRGDALFFGVEDDGMAMEAMQHAADAKHCRRCGAPYVYDAVYLGHSGATTASAAARAVPTRPSRPTRGRARRPRAARASRCARPQRRRRGRAPAPRPLQRLQRPRRRRARARARCRA